MLRNTTRIVLVGAILIAGTLTSGMATARASDQAPQDVRATPIDGSRIHVSWLDPLVRVGSSANYLYKIQWKSESSPHDYNVIQQVYSAGSDSYVLKQIRFQDSHTLRYDLFYRITGLETGVEYTVRVIRVTADGDSVPSNEATATPTIPDDILRMTVENLIARHGTESPWIQETWEYLQGTRVPIFVEDVGTGTSGSFDSDCHILDPISGLDQCITDYVEFEDPLDENIIVHELAHTYSMDSRVLANSPEESKAIAIALIYLDRLEEHSGGFCNKYEFLADLMTLKSLGDKADPSYWIYCDLTSRTDEALEVVEQALDGHTPQWFSETYSVSGTPNLEQLWTNIQEFEPLSFDRHEEEQQLFMYHLRNAFGGYCDNAKATASMFGDGPTRNPWKDGGCVPSAPEIDVTADKDGHLSVGWTVPDDDGGAPIEGYRVRWRSADQRYEESRQVTIPDPSTLSHRLGVLDQGIQHHVQVLAYNTNGNGTLSGEAAAVTNGNPSAGSPYTRTGCQSVARNTPTDTHRPDWTTWWAPHRASPGVGFRPCCPHLTPRHN